MRALCPYNPVLEQSPRHDTRADNIIMVERRVRFDKNTVLSKKNSNSCFQISTQFGEIMA